MENNEFRPLWLNLLELKFIKHSLDLTFPLPEYFCSNIKSYAKISYERRFVYNVVLKAIYDLWDLNGLTYKSDKTVLFDYINYFFTMFQNKLDFPKFLRLKHESITKAVYKNMEHYGNMFANNPAAEVRTCIIIYIEFILENFDAIALLETIYDLFDNFIDYRDMLQYEKKHMCTLFPIDLNIDEMEKICDNCINLLLSVEKVEMIDKENNDEVIFKVKLDPKAISEPEIKNN